MSKAIDSPMFAGSTRNIPFSIAALLLLALPLFGQPAPVGRQSAIAEKFSRFRHYTMEQGLSNNWVRGIAQDDDGFLWFATQEGLSRFDGEHFAAFFQRSDGKGLPSDHVTQIVALPDHRLLLGTEKGLCVLYTRRLEFAPVALPPQSGETKSDMHIWKIYKAGNGLIWISTNTGLHVLDEQLRVIHSYSDDTSKEKAFGFSFTRDFLELPDGTIAIKFSTSGLVSRWHVIDFQQQKAIPLATVNPGCGVLDSAFTPGNIVRDGNTFWYSTLGTKDAANIYRFDWNTQRCSVVLQNRNMTPEDMKRNQYNQPFLLPDSLLLLQRFFGAPLIYDMRDGSVIDLPQWQSSLPDGKVIVSFVDRDGNLWLCPRSEGVYFLTLKNLPTTAMTALNEAHKSTMKKMGVAEEWFGFGCIEQGNRWVVSSPNGGLYSMDKSGRGVSGEILSNPFAAYAYVVEFAPDRGDTLWINSLDGLNWYDPLKNTNGKLKAHIPGLDSLDNRFIFRDHYGLIWGRVRNNGVCSFDTRTRKLTHFPSKGDNAVFPLVSATACAEGTDGDMWFSFGSEEKYLVRWRRKTGIFEKIEPHCPQGINCSKAFNLMTDTRGNLWLNADQRWFVMNIQDYSVKSFGKDNGLVTNNPEGYCIDRDGNVWFATTFGLSRYDPLTAQLRTFYQSDGLLSNILSNVALIDTARNILFVSTDRGLCLFEPDKIGTATSAPPTFITGLRQSDRDIPIPASNALTFPYYQNDMRIEFTAVDFINGAMNRYQYSMEKEGRPAEWKDAGTDNFANFLNLAPGRYTFQARTANSDGAWGESVASLSIVIYPPWWRTWTFQLSLLAALALGGWWFYRRQISRAEMRESEKAKVRQQMGDLEMRALRAQMNPHFVFNALNSVQNFILKNDTREASRYLTKFARLMRLILENSESPVVPLAREIELLRYYTELEALRFNHRFSFDFQIDSSINAESEAIPGMLIQPHIENAIWHGLMHKEGAGQLWIRFIKADDSTIVCEIEDNGVGRARAAEIEKDRPKNHRSTGLSNIRNRLKLLNTQLASDISLEFIDLYDEQGNATGTKVVVRMPAMLNQSFTSSNN